MTTKRTKKDLATRLFGEKDPNFQRQKPTKIMHTGAVTPTKRLSDGTPRPRKRVGKRS